MLFLYVLQLLCLSLGLASGQALPFTVTGFLDSATAKTGTALNRGGSVSISGFNVVIPDNLIVEFPALMVPFAEFVSGGPGARAPPNEVTITGNIVNDVIIAGQFSISQLDLAFASGVIESLNSDGRIKIKNGPTIRINDPRAKYSAGYTGLPFFTADDENPSITSFSGFPMCVPRGAGDEKCPDGNRPAGSSSFVVPDASHMVPIRTGDYIEYSGVQLNGETICYTITVNIDIRTSGSQPGFVRVEDTIIGIADAGANVEEARHRFIGLASRSDLPVSIWAIDQDPCTGVESDRLITSTNVIASARNKWTVDVAKGTNIGLYTRNYRIKIGDNVVTTTDDIDAGQYVQPVTEWIFPELVTPGGAPPPLDFSNIGPLRNGFGPINGTIFGQLNPWPGQTAPTPLVANCPPPTTSTSSTAPTSTPTGPVNLQASAGTDQTVLSGVFVTLSASQLTTGINPSDLTFLWSQISGPALALSSTTTATTSLAPPVIPAGQSVSREYLLTITHTPSGSKANDTVVVTASRSATSFDHPVIDALTWASRQSGTATATAHTDLVDAAGSMRIVFGNGAERPMTRASTANGKATYTFSSRSVPTYASAVIRSYIDGVLVPGPVVSSTNVQPG